MKANPLVVALLFSMLGATIFQLPAQQSGTRPKPAEISAPSTSTDNINELKARAEIGDAKAQCILGDKYHHGEGLPRDYAEAVKWYRKAAEEGDTGGQHSLGFMYEYGEGVPRDYAEALKWYRKAAE